MNSYSLYVCDVETTGLNHLQHDVIELSLLRLYDGCQKTWKIKPFNESTIDSGALRVNGHKLEDLLHQTKFGRDNYKKASDVLVEVENWLLEDNVSSEFRLLVGQNINFDKSMLEQLWLKCDSKDTFPFGRRTMDTMMIEFFLDWCKNTIAEGYSLNNLTKKYGVKNEKAHTAEADVKATKEVFEKQIEYFKKVLASQK